MERFKSEEKALKEQGGEAAGAFRAAQRRFAHRRVGYDAPLFPARSHRRFPSALPRRAREYHKRPDAEDDRGTAKRHD